MAFSGKIILEARLVFAARAASDRRYARKQVAYALKKGLLKKEPCVCGSMDVEAHHADYSRPLDVIWACKLHHVQLDKLRRERDLEHLTGIRL